MLHSIHSRLWLMGSEGVHEMRASILRHIGYHYAISLLSHKAAELVDWRFSCRLQATVCNPTPGNGEHKQDNDRRQQQNRRHGLRSRTRPVNSSGVWGKTSTHILWSMLIAPAAERIQGAPSTMVLCPCLRWRTPGHSRAAALPPAGSQQPARKDPPRQACVRGTHIAEVAGPRANPICGMACWASVLCKLHWEAHHQLALCRVQLHSACLRHPRLGVRPTCESLGDHQDLPP